MKILGIPYAKLGKRNGFGWLAWRFSVQDSFAKVRILTHNEECRAGKDLSRGLGIAERTG